MMLIFKPIQTLFNKLFNRKENIMSVEQKAENLIEAVTDLIKSINAAVNSEKVATTDSAAPATDKPTKKELTELRKAAKTKAGEVLKGLGKEKLSELLSRFGSGKFSELLNEADVFNDFIKKAEDMLAEETPGSEDDDLLGDGPASKEYTIEDIKALLLKVNNAPTLGRDVTREILGELGVARLPELKKEKFAQAIEKIEATLKDAGVE